VRGVVGEDEFESREGRRAYSGDLTENSENGGNKRDGESHLCCERGKANGDGLRVKRNGREEPKIQRKPSRRKIMKRRTSPNDRQDQMAMANSKSAGREERSVVSFGRVL